MKPHAAKSQMLSPYSWVQNLLALALNATSRPYYIAITVTTATFQGNARQLFYKDVGVVAGDITSAADLQQTKKKIRCTSVCMTLRFILSCGQSSMRNGSAGAFYHRIQPVKALISSSDVYNYDKCCYFTITCWNTECITYSVYTVYTFRRAAMLSYIPRSKYT
jgi:hypothetical protein